MFTGIIEEIGQIVAVEQLGDAAAPAMRLTVHGALVTSDAKPGDSIQVSGVCLTVTGVNTTAAATGHFTADVMAQTLNVSTLATARVGDRVNLERAARADGRLGGHIVQGHVDGVATLLAVTEQAHWRVLRFSLSSALAPLVAAQGSIAVAGVSLTVSGVAPPDQGQQWFEVSLIPETLTATVLGELRRGDRVNIETDVFARQIARMLRFGAAADAGVSPEHDGGRAATAPVPPATPSASGIATIEAAIDALAAGRPVIVADDEQRENEGDVILSAELATPEWVAWAVRWSSGLLCAPMTNAIADQLDLPMMVARNEDVRGTAYTVTVDAASGVTTGISASDRCATLHALAHPAAVPTDVRRPGHVLPLRAVDGGVRARAGHTEAAVELMRLAGLRPVAMIAEIVAEDGEMMRLPGLIELGARERVPVITIEQLIAHLAERDPAATQQRPTTHRRVSLRADTIVPTEYGEFRMRAYRDRRTGIDHVALVAARSDGSMPGDDCLVRVHSECITGEAFGSLKCECGPQLVAALELVQRSGGVVIYLRGQEGRGIGLANKLRAYQLQESGIDTLEANVQLGLPADARDYTAAAEILTDLGLRSVKLLTNNPEKLHQLERQGVRVTHRVPLYVGLTEHNTAYVTTKQQRMGHLPNTEE